MLGDPAIRWQILRDLLKASDEEVEHERQKVGSTGWGARLLSFQESSGLWAGSLYSRKWISTTYSMLLLRRLGLDPNHPQALTTCKILLEKGIYNDGGINYFPSYKQSETCVTGMILSLLAYFNLRDPRISLLAEYLLREQMPDGGWNCEKFKGATHGSFHTTISVLEGLREYEKNNPGDVMTIQKSRKKAVEFLLAHRLFRSHRTGEVVDPRMTRLSFPPRWRYDILRALDFFREVEQAYNSRMDDALEILRNKQTADGMWPLQNRHPGKTYFEMEAPGQPSRWNTLRALRVLRFYDE